MARRPRSYRPGTFYHLISRFVGGAWFIESEVERRAYERLLGFHIARSDWRCVSFAIMSNHIHLGVVAGTATLASWIGQAHSDFAQWVNGRRERIGSVFVRGPRAIAVVPDGIARVIAYIHCNPVRAGVVSHPSESTWTSHRAYTGLGRRPSWLDVGAGVELAGFRDPSEMDEWIARVGRDRKALDGTEVARKKRGRPRRTVDRAEAL